MKGYGIRKIEAREIIDSRGFPTVETRVELDSRVIGIASVPSGASRGIHEAQELRDGDQSRLFGKGVLLAVKNINEIISPALLGMDATDQRMIDEKMIALDQSENKSSLGANAILSVSLAVARAAANSLELPLYKYLGAGIPSRLPTPMFNLLNGGAHASNNLDIQEFMIVPHSLSPTEGIRAGLEIYQMLKKILKDRGLSVSVGDEGGFAPDLSSDEEAIRLLCQAIDESGYNTEKIGIALDVASSEWYEKGVYVLPKSGKSFTKQQLIDYYLRLCESYPIISIEDGMSEDDFDGWKRLTELLGKKIMLVGDDLFVTNQRRFDMGIKLGIGNSILIKPNQIGTLTETIDVIDRARSEDYKFIISHRSGETEDSFISDLAVGASARFIKAGAPCRGERVAKYNRLLQIYSEISSL